MIDNVAYGVGPARARIAADRIHARSFRRAIIVLGALDLDDRRGSTAGTTTTADVAARAHAHHGAYRMCGQYPTLGRFRARLYNWTRVLTPVAETGERIRAIAVLSALGSFLRPAIDVWMAGEVRRTAAYRQMVQHPALGAWRAWVVVYTRINALHIDARVIARTITITVAADHAATVQRIAVVAVAAATVGYMVVGEAFGVGAAGIRD